MNKHCEELEVSYFKLKQIKRFKNGSTIPGSQKLIQSRVSDGELKLYNTVDNTNQTIWFWASDDEVEFIEVVVESWTYEELKSRNQIIENSWL